MSPLVDTARGNIEQHNGLFMRQNSPLDAAPKNAVASEHALKQPATPCSNIVRLRIKTRFNQRERHE